MGGAMGLSMPAAAGYVAVVMVVLITALVRAGTAVRTRRRTLPFCLP